MEEYRHKITETEIRQVFAEWARQFQQDPDGFVPMSVDEPEFYGKEAAEEFLVVLEEIRAGFAKPRD